MTENINHYFLKMETARNLDCIQMLKRICLSFIMHLKRYGIL